jgi:hypothetical protein
MADQAPGSPDNRRRIPQPEVAPPLVRKVRDQAVPVLSPEAQNTNAFRQLQFEDAIAAADHNNVQGVVNGIAVVAIADDSDDMSDDE